MKLVRANAASKQEYNLSEYLIHAVSLDAKLASEALGGVHLGAVFGQLALVVVAHSRLKNSRCRWVWWFVSSLPTRKGWVRDRRAV